MVSYCSSPASGGRHGSSRTTTRRLRTPDGLLASKQCGDDYLISSPYTEEYRHKQSFVKRRTLAKHVEVESHPSQISHLPTQGFSGHSESSVITTTSSTSSLTSSSGPVIPSLSDRESSHGSHQSYESNLAVLTNHFPHVDRETIEAVIIHDLRGYELCRLDVQFLLKKQRKQAIVSSIHQDYDSLESLLVPLTVYFDILTFHVRGTGKSHIAAHGFFLYIAHLSRLVIEYEWPGVLAYHLAFFAKRRVEMMEGDLTGWSTAEREYYDLLTPWRRNASRMLHI